MDKGGRKGSQQFLNAIRDKEASRKAGVCVGAVGMTSGFVKTASQRNMALWKVAAGTGARFLVSDCDKELSFTCVVSPLQCVQFKIQRQGKDFKLPSPDTLLIQRYPLGSENPQHNG